MSELGLPPDFPRQRTAGGTAFIAAGKGRPMLLIHGVGMNAEAMYPQIAHFSRAFRVLAIDMPGHGDTPALPGRPALADYMAHAAGFLRELHLDKAVLVGHSMGSLVALSLALSHPELTSGVVALNAVYCRTPEASAKVRARAAEIARAGGSGDIEGPMRRWFGDEPGHDALKSQVRRWLAVVPGEGYAAAYQVFAESDRAYEGRLAALRMPALFLTGEGDPNSTPEMSRRMASEAPQGSAVVLEGCRHIANLTDPARVNAAIEAWLKEVRP